MICNFCGRIKEEKEEFIASANEPKAYMCFKCLGDALVMVGETMIHSIAKMFEPVAKDSLFDVTYDAITNPLGENHGQ